MGHGLPSTIYGKRSDLAMKYYVLYTICALLFGMGCHADHSSRRPEFRVISVTKSSESYKGYAEDADMYLIVLNVSNVLKEAIAVWELRPGWQPCAFEVLESGTWSNVHSLWYGAHSQQRISLEPLQSRNVSVVFPGTPKPWRITADYFILSTGSLQVHKMSSQEMPPLLN